jgi:hypothetical protein
MTHFNGTKVRRDDEDALRVCYRTPRRKVSADAPYVVALHGRTMARLPDAASVARYVVTGRLMTGTVSYRGETVLDGFSSGTGKRGAKGVSQRVDTAALRRSIAATIRQSARKVDARVRAYRARIEKEYAA